MIPDYLDIFPKRQPLRGIAIFGAVMLMLAAIVGQSMLMDECTKDHSVAYCIRVLVQR